MGDLKENSIEFIICKNTVESVVESLQKAIKKGISGNPIKDMCLVDSNEQDIVIIISNNTIGKDVASAFWLGYQSALSDR